MNKLDVQYIKTCHEYSEYYWMIDNKPIVEYLDEYVKEGLCPELEKFGTMLGLLPAWTGELEWKSDNDFIWELVDNKQDLNIPILVCEDDCDLNCIVIMVHARFTEAYVYWDRIGLLNHENEDFEKEKESGILYLEAYTDEDWKKYGSNIACEKSNTMEYREWISKNWDEELLRRRRNYTKPYMQQEENIIWIKDTKWVFDVWEYNEMIEKYREIYTLKK